MYTPRHPAQCGEVVNGLEKKMTAKWVQRRDSEKGWVLITFRIPDPTETMPTATYHGPAAVDRLRRFCEAFLGGMNAAAEAAKKGPQ